MANNNKTKKGAASIYVVVFVTLLLGIITVSFVRLILRESTDTTNSELSASSRDAALAGVEDAKRAIDANYTGTVGMNECGYVKAAVWNDYDPSDPNSDPEVMIQTNSNGTSKTEQAYTCVTINPRVSEYKGKLDGDNTVAIIPLKGTDNPDYVEFSWQQNVNGSSLVFQNGSSFTDLDNQNAASGEIKAPVISFQYIQVPSTVDPVGNYDPYKQNTSIYYLTPEKDDDTVVTEFALARNDEGYKNEKKGVNCTTSRELVCKIKANLPAGSDTMTKYLVVSLPYGQSSTGSQTDFEVKMFKSGGGVVEFDGVQYLVDSTGRANDLYTRLGVRLNSVDPNFPYPQFSLQTEGPLMKYFWVTEKCRKVDNGSVDDTCPTSGDLS